jgi:hypothetical protein
MVPCPGCGHFQPDMIAGRRLRRHAVVFLAIMALFALMFVSGMTYVLSAAVTLWLVFFGAAAAWIAYTWIGFRNPNHRIRANKALAEQMVAQKRVQPVAADPQREDRPRPVIIETGAGFWIIGFLLLGATVALMPGAEVVRMGSAWPWNPHWHPPIVGPGDTSWVWVVPKEPFESLRGEWKATGSVQVVGGVDPQQKQQGAVDKEWKITTHTGHWGDLTGVSRTAPPRLWAGISIPNQMQLRHRRIELEVTLHVTTPELGGEGQARIVEREHDVTMPVEVHLARPFAGWLYGSYWTIALLGGGAMFLLAGGYHLMSDLALKNSAPPTRVTALSDEEAEGLQQPAPAPTASQPAQEQTAS